MLSICSSTSLVDILPLKRAEAVRYLPCLGSEAHIMFLASNICWVSSGTVRARYCWDPREVRAVTPDIQAEHKWLRSPYVGVVSLRVRKQMSYRASLSRHMHSSAFSTSRCTDRVALYGSTTVSDTLGDGTTEKVSITRSGYSSRILEMRRVPIPAPVPPPREWQSWKPWRQSQDSASLRTTSSTESMSSAPSV